MDLKTKAGDLLETRPEHSASYMETLTFDNLDDRAINQSF